MLLQEKCCDRGLPHSAPNRCGGKRLCYFPSAWYLQPLASANGSSHTTEKWELSTIVERGLQGSRSNTAALSAVRKSAQRLTSNAANYTPLLNLIGDARFALIGEASHSTHEFYHERAEVTKRLIVKKGFTTVAVEADWPRRLSH